MMTDIPEKSEREKFIRKSDVEALSRYFFFMENLAKRKGGKYKDAYFSDIQFMTNMNVQSGGDPLTNIMNIFDVNKNNQNNNNDSDSDSDSDNGDNNNIVNTEYYTGRVGKMVNKKL